MAKINFPSSPSDGDFFFANGVYYVYDSNKDIWKVLESGSTFSVVDAQTLEGEPGAYYLNYNNLANKPVIQSGNVVETTNLFYTEERFDTRLASKTTSNLTEGSNQYFTNARARIAITQGSGISYNNSSGVVSANVVSVSNKTGAVEIESSDIIGLTTANVSELSNLYYTEDRFDTRLSSKSTTDLAEGNNLYFSNARVIAGLLDSGNAFPSGTKMLFVQSSAPVGWTKDTTHDDKALRVVSGSVGTGGNTSFTAVFTGRTPTGNVGNTTLTAAQSGVPAHSHEITDPTHAHTASMRSSDTTAVASYLHFDAATTGGTQGFLNIGAASTGITINNSTPANATQGHNHEFTGNVMDFAVQYVDVIIATKD